ncbi:MAG: allophanate hydrolase [Betaproteobacteria bacterium]|nr:allophanate hydrolase [Betaproteobacteria bacterium]
MASRPDAVSQAARTRLAERAWITRFPAPILTESPSTGETAAPLAGLTFAVKDNIDVAGQPTTAACPGFDRFATKHAVVVQRLLQSGAQLLGKTNLDQFACGLNGTRSPFGSVPNALNSDYVSGGSSAGSAVVVASGEVDFALGTDTAGSGRVPAGLNNIVGLKPSRGLISARGVLPAAQSVDCVSIFARSVGLAAQVLQAALAFDIEDPYSQDRSLRDVPYGRSFRFGVPDVLEFHGDHLAAHAFQDAIAKLKSLGGTAVTIDFSPLRETGSLLYESALVAERYSAIRAFFDADPTQVIEPVRTIIEQGRGYSAADLYDAQHRLQACAQRAGQLWRQMDVLLVPTAPTHYRIDAMLADPIALNRNLGTYTNFVNLLDYAAISVPSCLRSDGLPFGITLIGPGGSDWALAELGQRYHHSCALKQGATSLPLPDPIIIPGLNMIPEEPTVRIAVVGAHLSGMPLNTQLTERQAILVREAETAPDYQFFALPGTVPPKPGLLRVDAGNGARIALELWDMPLKHYGSFVALVPAPLSIGTLKLNDGSEVQGFLCEHKATEGALNISHLGGWRAYIASRPKV